MFLRELEEKIVGLEEKIVRYPNVNLISH